MRFRLPRAPRRLNRGLERSVGQEVQPLAVGAPRGANAVVAVGGKRLNCARIHVVKADLQELVCRGLNEAQPTAVGRPSQIVEVAEFRLSDSLVLPGANVIDPKLLVLVPMRQPSADGRWNRSEEHTSELQSLR